jgi:hypothetical protein
MYFNFVHRKWYRMFVFPFEKGTKLTQNTKKSSAAILLEIFLNFNLLRKNVLGSSFPFCYKPAHFTAFFRTSPWRRSFIKKMIESSRFTISV